MYCKENLKLKGFTLTELLVVMITAVIIVGICFTVLTLIQRHFNSYQLLLNQKFDNSVLEDRLYQDFNRSESIVLYPENKLKAVFIQSKERLYSFHPAYVVIDMDTLSIKIKNLVFFNQGNAVTEGEVDAVEIDFQGFKPEKAFVFRYHAAAKAMRYGN